MLFQIQISKKIGTYSIRDLAKVANYIAIFFISKMNFIIIKFQQTIKYIAN